MRSTAGFLGCCALACWATAWPTEPSPIHLLGYYRLYDRYSVWLFSDPAPWYIVNDAPWADPRLVKWGYVPVTHEAQNFYCLIGHEPLTGSHLPTRTLACGDPLTVEQLYDRNRPYSVPYQRLCLRVSPESVITRTWHS